MPQHRRGSWLAGRLIGLGRARIRVGIGPGGPGRGEPGQGGTPGLHWQQRIYLAKGKSGQWFPNWSVAPRHGVAGSARSGLCGSAQRPRRLTASGIWWRHRPRAAAAGIQDLKRNDALVIWRQAPGPRTQWGAEVAISQTLIK